MEIQSEVRKTDLILVNLIAALRIPTVWVFPAVVFLTILTLLIIGHKREIDVGTFTEIAIKSIVWFVIFTVLMFCVCTLIQIISATVKSGVIGKRTFSIENDGFCEITEVNNNLEKWPAIYDILKTRNYIFVRVRNYFFYIIPRRSFASKSHFESFWQELVRMHKTYG